MDELPAALDAIASTLRVLGRTTPEEDVEVAEAFERWARHMLILSPPEEIDDDETPATTRQYARMISFVEMHRRDERAGVRRAMGDMRDALWTLVECVGRTSIEQGRSGVELRAHVEKIAKSVQSDSIEQLRREATELASAVTRIVDEQERGTAEQNERLKRQLARLEHQLGEARRESSTDPLTKLANRRTFDASLARAVTLASATRSPLSLVVADIDHFKAINDRYGHPGGDRVLEAVANALARSFPRKSDVVARYGGEEFAIILADTAAKDTKMLVERLLGSVRTIEVPFDNLPTCTLTMSAGFGELRPGETPQELVARVDRALYRAKNGGRNRAVETSRGSGLMPAVVVPTRLKTG